VKQVVDRRTERAERRRHEILDAAAVLFAEQGFAGTDTDELAARLKVGKGTLYRYFPSKEALFLAAADRLMKRLRQFVADELTDIVDPLERVRTGVRAFLQFCSMHPQFVELLIQERAAFKDRPTPTYFEHREAHIKKWQDLYREMIGRGRLRDIPVERISDVLSSALYGTIFINHFTGSRKTWQQQADDVLDIFLLGILSQPERRRGRSA
jgi:AcrR family transcriptional regulator